MKRRVIIISFTFVLCLVVFGHLSHSHGDGLDERFLAWKYNTPQDSQVDNVETGRMVGFTEDHNTVRRELGLNLPDLVWSDELADYAEEWATELQSRGCEMEHRPRSGIFKQKHGENLAWCRGFDFDPAGVVHGWAKEVSDYDYQTNSCSGMCGHYTQIVWKNSKRVGCAMKSCDDDSEIWVCNYDPPGNYIGQRPY